MMNMQSLWAALRFKLFGTPERTSSSAVPSTGTSTSEPTGPRLTERLECDVADVVSFAHYNRLAIQSDWARVRATAVSAAASLGLITTESPEGFGRVWHATALGLYWLEGGEL